MEKNYYVYVHKNLDGVVFYVGKGTKNRYRNTCNRSESWRSKAALGWTHQIVKSDLTNAESLVLEKHLISVYKDTVVNYVSSQIVKEINISDFSGSFYYDPTSPSCLRWKIPKYKFSKGSPAGSEFMSNGVPHGWRVMLNKKTYYIHRIIWALFHGETDRDMVIDHLDGNPFNNIISNLQIKTRAGNMLNKAHTKTSTGITGVTEGIGRKGIPYFRASWVDELGNQKFRTFSTNKYGREEAFKLAREVRETKIRELRALGFDYTDRHLVAG